MEESYCPSSLVSVERLLLRDRSMIHLLGFGEQIFRDLSILFFNSAIRSSLNNLVLPQPQPRPPYHTTSYHTVPNHTSPYPTVPQCPYTNIGIDCTITGPQVPPSYSHIDVPSQVTAIAKLHLQKNEQGKLVHPGKADMYT